MLKSTESHAIDKNLVKRKWVYSEFRSCHCLKPYLNKRLFTLKEYLNRMALIKGFDGGRAVLLHHDDGLILLQTPLSRAAIVQDNLVIIQARIKVQGNIECIFFFCLN